jgi:hypothetical protein
MLRARSSRAPASSCPSLRSPAWSSRFVADAGAVAW